MHSLAFSLLGLPIHALMNSEQAPPKVALQRTGKGKTVTLPAGASEVTVLPAAELGQATLSTSVVGRGL